MADIAHFVLNMTNDERLDNRYAKMDDDSDSEMRTFCADLCVCSVAYDHNYCNHCVCLFGCCCSDFL